MSEVSSQKPVVSSQKPVISSQTEAVVTSRPQAQKKKSDYWRLIADYFRAAGAVIRKDLSAERRSKELISAMLVFSLLVVLIFNFALELDRQARENVVSGVLWVTFIFAGTIGLNRSLAMEKDRCSSCCWARWDTRPWGRCSPRWPSTRARVT